MWINFLYLATLMKVFVNCRSFLAESLVSFMYTVMSSANKETLTSFQFVSLWISFIQFFSALAKTFKVLYFLSTLFSSTDFSGIIWVIFQFKFNWLWGYYLLPLLCWPMSLVSLICPGHLSWKGVFLSVCLYGLFYLLICIYWTFPAFPESHLLDHARWCFEFGLQVFYWEFLHVCSYEKMVCHSLSLLEHYMVWMSGYL